MTVKAWLKGQRFDLETLSGLFPSGDVHVARVGEEYYLVATEIESPPDGRKFYEVAPVVLQHVNGIASAMRPNDYRPVELAGRYQVGENHHEIVQAESAEARDHAFPVTVVVASAAIENRVHVAADAIVNRNGLPVDSPPLAPTYIALAAQHADVAEALVIMGRADSDWTDLYKVFEIVRDNVRPVKMEGKGLATKQEQGTFTGSANRPDVSGADARHARMPGGPPVRTMSLQQARQFIGDLVMRWMNTLQP